MSLDRKSFPIWKVMIVVAIAACLLSIANASLDPSRVSDSLYTLFVCSILVPILVIFVRGVPLKTLAYVLKIGSMTGLPFAITVGLAGAIAGAGVRCFGGILMVMLTFVWSSLTVAAFQSTRGLPSGPDRPSPIDHRLFDLPEKASERN